MRRRWMAVAAALAALAAGGTAIAAPLLGGDPRERRAEFAKDLADNLEGVTPAEVERALEKIRDEHVAERHAQLAEDLAPKLDLDVSKVRAALAKVHDQIDADFRSGQRPQPGAFAKALAKELGKTEAEVRKALTEVRKTHLDERLDAAVKAGRLTQAEADQIRKRIEEGDFRGRGGPQGGGTHGIGGPHGGGPHGHGPLGLH